MVKTPLPPGTMLEVHFSVCGGVSKFALRSCINTTPTLLEVHFSVRRSVSKLALRSCINTTPTLFPGGGVFYHFACLRVYEKNSGRNGNQNYREVLWVALFLCNRGPRGVRRAPAAPRAAAAAAAAAWLLCVCCTMVVIKM